MGEDRRYLIEVLLRARDNISQVTSRAVSSIDNLTRAQNRSTDAAERARRNTREQITELSRLVEAHIREKRALEETAGVFAKSAAARRAEADAAKRRLEDLRKESQLEKATANQRVQRDREEVTRLRRIVAERDASDAKRTRAFTREQSQMRKQATLLEAQANQEAAANKVRASQLDLQVAQASTFAQDAERVARATEQHLRHRP
jgi:hypothetical protein